MQDWHLVIASIFGGGGIVAAIVKIYELKRASDGGELEREDTQIRRWKAIAVRAEAEEAKAARRAAWYQQHYYLARDRLTRDQRGDLPAGPPADMY